MAVEPAAGGGAFLDPMIERLVASCRKVVQLKSSLGIEPMPARPEMVASYLSACADSGLTAGSIQRRVSAIAAIHNAAGYDSPASGPVRKGKRPTLTTDIAAMCAHLPAGLLFAQRTLCETFRAATRRISESAVPLPKPSSAGRTSPALNRRHLTTQGNPVPKGAGLGKPLQPAAVPATGRRISFEIRVVATRG